MVLTALFPGLVRVAALAALAVAVPAQLAFADENAGNPPVLKDTRPSEENATPPDRANAPTTQEATVSAADWEAVEAFMRQNSPNKWRMYQSLPDRPLKQGLRRQVVQRFRAMERVRVADAKRWKMEVRAVALEDDIYGILQAMRSGVESDANESLLREKVDELLRNRDEWRLERLTRVKTELISLKLQQAVPVVEGEISRLREMNSDDRRGRVEKRLEELKKHVNRPRPLLGGRRPGSEVPADDPQDEMPNPR